MSPFLALPLILQLIIFYAIIINIITFFFFGFDKLRSQVQHASRVSEKTLWLLTLIGGSFGALAGMNFFRHKTKKLSFQVGIAIVIGVQIMAIYLIIK